MLLLLLLLLLLFFFFFFFFFLGGGGNSFDYFTFSPLRTVVLRIQYSEGGGGGTIKKRKQFHAMQDISANFFVVVVIF